MNYLIDILITIVRYLKADWLILLIGTIIAVGINVYLDPDKFKSYLEKNSALSIPGSVAFGAFTPLCACGTMAVILSMFISSLPWGPVMAFLVSSPLTSPSEFLFEVSFFGYSFAIAVLVSSIIMGLSAGFIAHALELKTSFFRDQFRIKSDKGSCCTSVEEESIEICCSSTEEVSNEPDCCSIKKSSKNADFYHIAGMATKEKSLVDKLKISEFISKFWEIGIKKILLYFVIFIALGRIVELIIPSEWILALFSKEKAYSVPLGAVVGLPLYISGPSALPLIRSFMNAGAGEGAILAFFITGKATGIPVIAGMSAILKKKAILFYVGFVFIGGILSGYIYQIIMNFHR